MSTPTHHPITNALVARIREAPLYDDLTGIYQGYAPEKASYPFAVYNLVAAPYDYLFDDDDVTLIAFVDVSVFSRNPVEAENLDAAIAAWLSDQPLSVEGQSTLLCRRVATIPPDTDQDDEGHKVYQWGGTYEIQTNAPMLPGALGVSTTSGLSLTAQ